MPMGIGLGLTFTLAEAAGGKWWQSGSALDLDFANSLGFNSIDRTKTTPDSILTYTSPSPKLVYGDDGVLGYAPHNLLLRSQEFDNAAWSPGGGSVSANSASSPDGTITADTYTEDSATTRHAILPASAVTVAASATYTASVYAKYVDRQYLSLSFNYQSGADVYAAARFDLINGTVASTSNGGSGGTVTSSSITDVGGGWYRCTVSGTIGAFTTALIFVSTAGDGTTWSAGVRGSHTFSGTAKSVYIWGQQLNLGPSALTYIPTTSTAVYSLPLDHDPITFDPLGVLIEEQRTNLLTYSEQFDNAAWTKNRASITTNAIVAPDGTTTADFVVEDATLGQHYVLANYAFTSAAHTLSVYAKAGTRSWMYFSENSSGTRQTWFDLANGVVGQVHANHTASIVSVGNGWYRCSITFTAVAATTTFALIATDIANAGTSYTGDGASGLYLWGAQLEAGAFATSLIPTQASQVTRAADQVSILTSAFAYNAAEGTLYTEGRITSGGTAYFGGLSDNSGSDVEFMGNRKSGATYSSVVVDGGVTQASLTGGAYVAGAEVEVAFAYKANDFANSIDGAAVATDASGTLPTVTGLYVGAIRAALGFANGPIKRLTYFPTRKTNAELQVLST